MEFACSVGMRNLYLLLVAVVTWLHYAEIAEFLISVLMLVAYRVCIQKSACRL